MAATNVTLGSDGITFECGTTERTATLNVPGGEVACVGAADAWINTNGATVQTALPTGVGTSGNVFIPVGVTVKLKSTCRSFTFKSTAGTHLQYFPPN